MKKTAFLVNIPLLTRVVVDTNENNEILDWDDFVNKVTQNILDKIQNKEIEENIDEYSIDNEVPYDPHYDI